MTVRRGEPWGVAAGLPDGAPIAVDNAGLRRLVGSQREDGGPPAPIGVIGGDMWQVVGAPAGGAARLRSAQAQTAPIDLIEVIADGEAYVACAHAIARGSWWRGPVVAAMNAESRGAWRVAPAAHPNDGKLHVLSTGADHDGSSDDGTGHDGLSRGGASRDAPGYGGAERTTQSRSGLSVAQRALARRRLRTGTHLPHPAITVRRVQHAHFRFGRPVGLWLDGERVGRCRDLRMAILPDAALIVF